MRVKFGADFCIFSDKMFDDSNCSVIVAAGTTLGIGICTAFLLQKLNLFYIWTHKLDKDSKRNGGELVANVLQSHNVSILQSHRCAL